MPNDAKYLALILEPIRFCAQYKPKFGQGSKGDGLTLEQFQKLYQGDSFYAWFGLDNPMMYAAHKAAGGMTSIYRQIGIGSEKLFRAVLQDALGLDDADATWSYEVPLSNGKTRTLSLDGRVPLNKIADKAKRKRFQAWMRESAAVLGVDPKVISTLTGTVFEVRQGYKSKDSKRQNADIANAATAYPKAYLPCALILSTPAILNLGRNSSFFLLPFSFLVAEAPRKEGKRKKEKGKMLRLSSKLRIAVSTQIDSDILLRYRAEKWVVLTGIEGAKDPLLSTYDFMREVVGYDLAAFFHRNRKKLRAEIDNVLKALLESETT
jgi:hypothetical protein